MVDIFTYALCCQCAQVWHRVLARYRADCTPTVNLQPAVAVAEVRLAIVLCCVLCHGLSSMLQPDRVRRAGKKCWG